MRAVHMAVIVMAMIMVVIVVAVRAVNMRLLGHARLLRKIFAGNYLAIALHVHASAEE